MACQLELAAKTKKKQAHTVNDWLHYMSEEGFYRKFSTIETWTEVVICACVVGIKVSNKVVPKVIP